MKKNSILEDLGEPLNKVQNPYLRRGSLIILFPIIMIGGLVLGLTKMIEFIFDFYKDCWNVKIENYLTEVKIEHTLTDEDITNAGVWYSFHRNHINKLYNSTKEEYPPTLEDKSDPTLWKAEHWRWYINSID